jgi:2-polyprenyl-3-methyl-5-hydroxy-6-metoxy-1,4-benzoquinol methylase
MTHIAPRNASAGIYGGTFDPNATNNPRTLIAKWVAEGAHVLEVGPGDGVVGGWLKSHKRCRVIGVEYVPDAAAVAARVLDGMIVGSIEDEAIAAEAERHGPFNAVIFADVLEHLVDPWAVLRRVRRMLTPGGSLMLSMPNVAHWSARLNLLRGRWDYTDGYLMDKTHLRWFTRRTAIEMCQSSGYDVVEARAVHRPRFMRFWPELTGYQTVLHARSRSAS